MIDTSRRHVMTGTLAAIAAGGVVNLAAAAMPPAPDPIFAAIEQHKAAFLRQMRACKIYSETVTAEWAPDYERATDRRNKAAELRAQRAADKAANALATIRPQTPAGALALAQYIVAFNAGALKLPDDPDNWFSNPFSWPVRIDEAHDEDVFPFDLLSNVAAGLAQIAGGSAVQS